MMNTCFSAVYDGPLEHTLWRKMLHFYHGNKKDIYYDTPRKKLISNKFNPNKDLIYNKDGLLEYSKECPEKLKNDLCEYFTLRKEDE